MARRGCYGSATMGDAPAGNSRWQLCRQIRCWRIRARSNLDLLGLASVYKMVTVGRMRRVTFATISSETSEGSAKRLIKEALQEAARKREMRYSDLKRINKKVRRHFHDDITVILLFLNHDILARS